MIFSAIVANPPYQVSDGGAQASARPIYNEFVMMAKEMNPEYMSFITPTRWYAGGKGLDAFRKNMLDDIRISELHDFLHPEELFPNTNNRGGVCYFLWSREHDNTNNPPTIVTHNGGGETSSANRPLRTRGLDMFVRNSNAISIIEKVLPDGTEDTIEKHISPRKPFGLDGNFIKTADFHANMDDLTKPVKCYGKSKSVGYVERDNVRNHQAWIDVYKVFTPYANNIGTELNDDNQNTFVGEPGSICTETYLAIGMDLNLSKEASANLSNYLRTKFARFLHSLAKISQHGTAKTYRFVPLVDLSKNWTDQELFLEYKLSDEEISLIESSIKDMQP